MIELLQDKHLAYGLIFRSVTSSDCKATNLPADNLSGYMESKISRFKFKDEALVLKKRQTTIVDHAGKSNSSI
jgi:hypothetical protein